MPHLDWLKIAADILAVRVMSTADTDDFNPAGAIAGLLALVEQLPQGDPHADYIHAIANRSLTCDKVWTQQERAALDVLEEIEFYTEPKVRELWQTLNDRQIARRTA